MRSLIFMLMAVQPLMAADAAPKHGGVVTADPYLWLEETDGAQALDWARARNKETLTELEADPRYKDLYDKALAVNNSKDRIAQIGLHGEQGYNFWQDAEHVRGIWRRAPIAQYLKGAPAWETVLDLDRLAKEEGENWVFRWTTCLAPENRLCLVKLSRGGKDAVVMREFDTQKKAFVENGFKLPESSSGAAWLDENTLLLADALGPDSLTASAYPRVLRKWARGTDPLSAPVLLEGNKKDVELAARCYHRPEGSTCLLQKSTSYYEAEHFLLSGGAVKKMPLPPDAKVNTVFKGKLLLTLRSDWRLPGRVFKQNSLVAVALEKAGLPEEQAAPELVFEPGPRVMVNMVSVSKSAVLLSLLDNVQGRIIKLIPAGGAWRTETVPVPAFGSAFVEGTDDFSDDFFYSYESYLMPESLFYSKTPDKAVKQAAALYDAGGLKAEQREAVSRDGTRIPYFIVYPEGMKYDGSHPALLHGYGGFEAPMTSYYVPVIGKLWLEQGGVYAVANIRGGGEFGPAWHKAAQREKKQNSYDDFIAVAEDLIKAGVTAPAHLAIHGGSNGGLLVGAVLTQRPELFKAVLCEVPLLDMLRYTRLPHGAQWVGEYGDPDSPELGPVIAKYSPYQNIRAGVKYPDVFFLTSTKDDRVSPGHARKAAAKLLGFGNKVYYYENIDGGHSAEANKQEAARNWALQYVMLARELKD